MSGGTPWTSGPVRIEPQGDGARGYWLHDDDGEYVAMVCRRENKSEELGNANLYAGAHEMAGSLISLSGHLKLMQSAMAEHLKPDGSLRDPADFIQRIIYLLDGPEQRAAQEPARTLLTKIGAAQ